MITDQAYSFIRFRLTLACGGTAMNSFDDLTDDCLGHAGLVYEHVLVRSEMKYTRGRQLSHIETRGELTHL